MKRNIRWVRNRINGISICCFVIVSFFLIVYKRNTITNLRYEITALEDELRKEEVIQRELVIEITELRRAERIEELAKSYGFINISPSQIVFMKDVESDFEKKGIEKTQSFLARIYNVFATQKEDFQ